MKQKNRKIRVVVGMSGGVDSSVTAALLVDQGYDVVGVYMRNWNIASPTLGRRALSDDSYRDECPWYQDYLDAKRVALALGIPFYLWDFREAYKKKVFDVFIDEIEAGRTPNPDVYCNSLLKFDDFLEKAVQELEADFIATGHYAKMEGKTPALRIPKDTKKDQTYFLYRLSEVQLSKVMFPLADYTKQEVRQLAEKFDLPTKYKKDSVGLCYIGDVDIRSFVGRWLAPRQGEIRTPAGQVIGLHRGVHLYTIGEKVPVVSATIAKLNPEQKHEIPTYYVADKDIKNNILIAVPGVDHPALYKKEAVLDDFHVLQASVTESNQPTFARLRHGGALAACESVELTQNKTARVTFREAQRAVTPGQHLVLYDAEGIVLGGGVLTEPRSSY